MVAALRTLGVAVTDLMLWLKVLVPPTRPRSPSQGVAPNGSTVMRLKVVGALILAALTLSALRICLCLVPSLRTLSCE